MRLSKSYFKTLREVPAEAELKSHILLLRAGMIRKLASGVYGYMPMGLKALKKIENIIRNEMDAEGCQEILMSALQPAELWKESGRWNAYGPEMWRVCDRHEREFCLGPTHEEVFTDIIRNDVDSHRKLPINLYQIQTKYRDEARPRFGLMRSREFIMKDSYSFDKDEEGLDVSYENMYKRYENVFKRMELDVMPVEADTGAMGGNGSHEFIAKADAGESEIAFCSSCKMAATVERAVCGKVKPSSEAELPMNKVHTPGTKTIESVCEYLNKPTDKSIKAIFLKVIPAEGDEQPVAAFLRGDRQLNMIKAVNALGIAEHELVFADESEAADIGSVCGFIGPHGLKPGTKVIVDEELVSLKNLVAGANEEDYHIENLNYGRDYEADIVADIKQLLEGDPCPVCGEKILYTRGIEVGQLFKLGTKYSEPMKAIYKDEDMNERLMYMGSYGIGVSRTLAAVIEQNSDENGIIWPLPVAPYHVIITLINPSDKDQTALAEDIYEKLRKSNIDVILDDRDERPGVKFKDADLIGIPFRINVGRDAADGKVEFKVRGSNYGMDMKKGETVVIDSNEAVKNIISVVSENS